MSSAIINTKILCSVVMNNVKPVYCIVQLSKNSSYQPTMLVTRLAVLNTCESEAYWWYFVFVK